MSEYLCVFCEARNVHDTVVMPDYLHCKICRKHQQTGELNWAESTATLTLKNDTFLRRRF